MSTSSQTLALKAASILWVIWGLVHVLAGVIVVSQDTGAAFAAIADAVDPAALAGDYHPAVGGILNQHGFNLLWIGLTTIVCAVFIWRGNVTAIWVAALTGGLADVGYLVFVDLPGFVNFVPGTLMTIVSASAVVSSFSGWFTTRRANQAGT